ncbi:MAG: hypothetical protein HRJ53_28615 [Acidobacteria bacterium Pan2503]|uniref:Uncharacterized protein n=1 Tax=Candidatus Acidiferrum panamense TaxID=2741543 RepID=A0A7V8NX12_9BACT|nr:hypothetical protein [Candidatus Acidoferrum panamensis]
MAGPIQTLPQGLLGLLQLKSFGENPYDLLETVQPSVDLYRLWIERNAQDVQGLFGVASVNTAALVTGNHGTQNFGSAAQVTPSNEIWFVVYFTGTIQTIAAADTITGLQTGIFTSIPNGGVYLQSAPVSDVITARARSLATNPVAPFFVPPGSQFVVNVADILSVGGITVNLNLRAVRIPI